jgi:hypothetical protein
VVFSIPVQNNNCPIVEDSLLGEALAPGKAESKSGQPSAVHTSLGRFSDQCTGYLRHENRENEGSHCIGRLLRTGQTCGFVHTPDDYGVKNG